MHRTGGEAFTSIRSTVRVALAWFCGVLVLASSVSGQPAQWRLERTVTIGHALDPGVGLTRVGSVIVDGDRLLVAQPLEQRVRVFSLSGDFLGFIGRRGEGPGEFQWVDALGLHDGQVWIADSSLRRIQFFDDADRFVSSELFRGHPTLLGEALTVGSVLVDGSILATHDELEVPEFAAFPNRPGYVIRFDRQRLAHDTLSILIGRGSILQLSDGREGGWASYTSLPVSYRSILAEVPDGSGFVVVHREAATSSDPHRYRVIRFDARGDTAWAREFPYDPVRTTPGWRARHVEQHARESDVPGVPARRVRQVIERAYRTLTFLPPIDAAYAAMGGSTWLLARTGIDSFEWRVLDGTGRLIATVAPPPSGRIRWAGTQSVWFAEYDDFDIPSLVRYEIHRP